MKEQLIQTRLLTDQMVENPQGMQDEGGDGDDGGEDGEKPKNPENGGNKKLEKNQKDFIINVIVRRRELVAEMRKNNYKRRILN